MCNDCNDVKNDFKAFAGCEGIAFDDKTGEYYIVIEHFRNEINRTVINYCPWCGRKLSE